MKSLRKSFNDKVTKIDTYLHRKWGNGGDLLIGTASGMVAYGVVYAVCGTLAAMVFAAPMTTIIPVAAVIGGARAERTYIKRRYLRKTGRKFSDLKLDQA